MSIVDFLQETLQKLKNGDQVEDSDVERFVLMFKQNGAAMEGGEFARM